MRHSWKWNVKNFENIEKPNVRTQSISDTWQVHLKELDLAWGYCIALSEEACSHILWRATLEVLAAAGDISPGVAFHDGSQGLLLQANRPENIFELRYVNVNSETIRVEVLDIQEPSFPYTISLEYNAVTARCAGFLNKIKLFDHQLPFRNIPALFEVTSTEIVTTTAGYGDGGNVSYGGLKLDCE